MDLIGSDYLAQQKALHAQGNYATVGHTYAKLTSEICNKLEIDHLLDYGCGDCSLFRALKVGHAMKLQAYDPAIDRYASPPVPAQMVTCTEVLEHVEPELLDAVLDDLERLTEMVGLFSVCEIPAMKTLPDGRNAHLIQQPMEWWLPKFWERFDLQTVQRIKPGVFHVVCYARPKIIQAG